MNIDLSCKLIGDSLYPDPAIRAYAEINGPVYLFIDQHLRFLYENKDYIYITKEKHPNSLRPNEGEAFWYGANNKRHICHGFFPQFGLDPKDYSWEDLRPNIKLPNAIKNQDTLAHTKNGITDGIRYNDLICFAPFSASCASQQGEPANKTAPISWWEELATCIDGPVVSLGSKLEPNIENTINIRGQDLDVITSLLSQCRVLIGVDTGLVVLGSAVDAHILRLSAATPPYLVSPLTNGITATLHSDNGPKWDTKHVLDMLQSYFGIPVK